MFIYLDSSAKSRKVVQDDRENPFWQGKWGRYGAWGCVNFSMYNLTETISEEAMYAGDGFFGPLHLKWS